MTRGERSIYAAMAFAAVLLVTLFVRAETNRTIPDESLRYTRACVPATGSATAVACTNLASASSGALTPWTRYIMDCEADDAWLVFGTSSATATSAGFMLPKKSWFEFLTTDTTKYVACLGATTTPTCKLLECK